MTGHSFIRPAPAEIEFKNMRFLITEQPQDATIHNYISILKSHKVSHLVCATDPTYKTDDLQQAGVAVAQLPFPDGSAPTGEILEKWLLLVKKAFQVLQYQVLSQVGNNYMSHFGDLVRFRLLFWGTYETSRPKV